MDVIAAQAFVFFVAGFETSSTTMAFCLYELTQNPDIQERLQAEIDSVSEQHGGNITYDSILEMQYLDKIVNGEWKRRLSTSSGHFESKPLQQHPCICSKPNTLLPDTRITPLISVRGSVDPKAIVRLEVLGQLQNPTTSSGIEPAIFRLLA
jgi:hypothetical protein